MTLRWFSLCNGQFESPLPLDDRAAALGDGLFETLLVRQGRPVWLDEHLVRLALGCERLALDFPEQKLREEIRQLLAEHAIHYGVLRISLSRCGDGGRGYQSATRRCNRLLRLAETAPPARETWQGIKAFVCKTRLPEQAALAGIKHNNRLAHILARAERPPAQFPEGLMLSQSGRVVEGISSNVFLVADGALLTPILDLAGVAGIVRQKVMECAAGQGLEVRERGLTLDDVFRARELFFCSSLAGIVPVNALDCYTFSPPVVTGQLQAQLESIWYE